ncbi:MAG: hypothetical protein RLZZ238_2031 [Planctomycetota bacterium]|jgi:hypothetical protein
MPIEQLDMVIPQGADFEYLHEKTDLDPAQISGITAVATLRQGIGGSIIATWSTANGFITKSAHGNHIDFTISVPAATTAALSAPSSGVYDLDISYGSSWTVRHAEGAFYITPNV